jgi:hypothetical protein
MKICVMRVNLISNNFSISLGEKVDKTIDKEANNKIGRNSMIVSTRMIRRSMSIKHQLRKVGRKILVSTMERHDTLRRLARRRLKI